MVNKNKRRNIEKFSTDDKIKRTIGASIALIGILLAAGILFTILVLNSSSSVASAKSDNSDDHANALKLKNTKDAGTQTNIKAKSVWTEWKKMTPAQRDALRKDAAKRFKDAYDAAVAGGQIGVQAVVGPATGPCALDAANTPHYFGPCPNYATSQLLEFDASGNVIPGTGIMKFIDSLPGLGPAKANNLGQYIPVAVPNTTAHPGSDYYEIALVEYSEQMHSNLTNTTLRGYVQLNKTGVPLTNPDGTPILKADGSRAIAVDNPHYLGPLINATKDRPVRIKFYNLLPNGSGGDLFIPVDTTVPGAGPFTIDNPGGTGTISGNFTQNRAHLTSPRRTHTVDQRRHASPVDHPCKRNHLLPPGRQCVQRPGHGKRD